MASGEWLVASGRILLILIIGGIGVQTVYAKKDKTNAAKDTVAAVAVAVKAAEKEETIIKVDGILELGFDNHYKYVDYKVGKRVEYKRIGRAEVGASFKPVKKVRAEIGFEYNSKDSLPSIDKLYGQYSPLNFNAIRFGYMKKSFGLEEKTGLDERFFHKRSIINDSLDKSFGFLDHDLTLQYRHELTKELEFRGGFSWTKDSVKYLENFSVEYDDKKNNLILAAIIMQYSPPKNTILSNGDLLSTDMRTMFVSSLSYKRTGNLSASEVELTYGTNPTVKVYDNKLAAIFGARLKEKIFLNTGLNILHQVIPVAEAALYSSDFKKDSTEFDAQFRAGLTLGFAKKSALQWRTNYGIVSKIRDDEMELWRRRIDTELVVVF